MEFHRNIDLQDKYFYSDKIVARKIEDELIIIPVGGNVVDFENVLYTLNDIGRDIWERLSGDTTVEALCLALVEEYDAPFDLIQKDVLELLNELLERNLIEKRI